MTVNLTRIYTKLGDGGETHLGDMSRVPKTHPRIEAYGDVDELNSHIGVDAHAAPTCPSEHAAWLRRIQNDLFDVGADLVPDAATERLRVAATQVDVARAGAATRSTPSSSRSRASCCPAAPPRPRSCTSAGPCAAAPSAARCCVEDANPEVVRYLNRLSDLLFILARACNARRRAAVGARRYRRAVVTHRQPLRSAAPPARRSSRRRAGRPDAPRRSRPRRAGGRAAISSATGDARRPRGRGQRRRPAPTA